jgi:hypothetical protein
MDTALVAVSPDPRATRDRSRLTLVANRIMFKDVLNCRVSSAEARGELTLRYAMS